MAVLIFWSEKDPEFFGFTRQDDGGNLPSDLGPWKRLSEKAVEGGLAGLGPVEAIEAEVDANGWCVIQAARVTLTPNPIPSGAVRH